MRAPAEVSLIVESVADVIEGGGDGKLVSGFCGDALRFLAGGGQRLSHRRGFAELSTRQAARARPAASRPVSGPGRSCARQPLVRA